MALQSRLDLGKVDAKPSSTQVFEFGEQIALANDMGGLNSDRMWALALFWDDVEIPVGRDISWM